MNPYSAFLLKRERNEREKRRRLSERTLELLRAAIPELVGRFPEITTVMAFGSVVTRAMTEESDVDVYLEPLTAPHYWEAMGLLRRRLGRDVDVLTRSDDPFLVEEIKRSGEVLYG